MITVDISYARTHEGVRCHVINLVADPLGLEAQAPMEWASAWDAYVALVNSDWSGCSEKMRTEMYPYGVSQMVTILPGRSFYHEGHPIQYPFEPADMFRAYEPSTGYLIEWKQIAIMIVDREESGRLFIYSVDDGGWHIAYENESVYDKDEFGRYTMDYYRVPGTYAWFVHRSQQIA